MSKYRLKDIYHRLCKIGDYNRSSYILLILQQLNKELPRELTEYRKTVVSIYERITL